MTRRFSSTSDTPFTTLEPSRLSTTCFANKPSTFQHSFCSWPEWPLRQDLELGEQQQAEAAVGSGQKRVLALGPTPEKDKARTHHDMAVREQSMAQPSKSISDRHSKAAPRGPTNKAGTLELQRAHRLCRTQFGGNYCETGKNRLAR